MVSFVPLPVVDSGLLWRDVLERLGFIVYQKHAASCLHLDQRVSGEDASRCFEEK